MAEYDDQEGIPVAVATEIQPVVEEAKQSGAPTLKDCVEIRADTSKALMGFKRMKENMFEPVSQDLDDMKAKLNQVIQTTTALGGQPPAEATYFYKKIVKMEGCLKSGELEATAMAQFHEKVHDEMATRITIMSNPSDPQAKKVAPVYKLSSISGPGTTAESSTRKRKASTTEKESISNKKALMGGLKTDQSATLGDQAETTTAKQRNVASTMTKTLTRKAALGLIVELEILGLDRAVVEEILNAEPANLRPLLEGNIDLSKHVRKAIKDVVKDNGGIKLYPCYRSKSHQSTQYGFSTCDEWKGTTNKQRSAFRYALLTFICGGVVDFHLELPEKTHFFTLDADGKIRHGLTEDR